MWHTNVALTVAKHCVELKNKIEQAGLKIKLFIGIIHCAQCVCMVPKVSALSVGIMIRLLGQNNARVCFWLCYFLLSS